MNQAFSKVFPFLLLIATIVIFSPAISCSPSVQDTSSNDSQKKADEQDASKKQDVNKDQTVSKAQSSVDKINALLAEKQFDAAAKLLDESLELDPHNASLHAIRPKLAFHFNFGREQAKGKNQNEKLVEYVLDNHDRAPELVPLLGPALNSLNSAEIQNRKSVEELDKKLDLAIEIFRKHQPDKLEDAKYFNGLVTLVGIRTRRLRIQRKVEQAASLLNQTLSISKDCWENDVDNEFATLFYLQMLNTSIANGGEDKESNDRRIVEHDKVATEATANFPTSEGITSQYVAAKSRSIGIAIREDPHRAKEIYDETIATLNGLRQSQPANKVIDRHIKMIQQKNEVKIAATVAINNLIGTTAPDLEIEVWVNGDPGSIEKLRGNVLLLNFFALWSRHSVANISHLKDWQSEFEDKPFRTIGISRQGDSVWDEQLSRSSKSEQPLSTAEFSKEMEKFVGDLKVNYPVGLLKKDGATEKKYGVTGVPQFVLIDKSGKIQKVLAGSTPPQLKILHEKIQKLLAE